MTVKKSKAPKRTGKKQYTLIHFEVEGFEGEFIAPQMEAMSKPKITMGLNDGNFGPLVELLKEHDEGTAEAYADMDGEEQQAFFSAWSKAAGVGDSSKS